MYFAINICFLPKPPTLYLLFGVFAKRFATFVLQKGIAPFIFNGEMCSILCV